MALTAVLGLLCGLGAQAQGQVAPSDAASGADEDTTVVVVGRRQSGQ